MDLITNNAVRPMNEYLRGQWPKLLAAEGMLLASELLLILVSLHSSAWFIWVILLADLCLLSPLKSGIALLYDTILADPDNADLGLLWRYYAHGYGKCLRWRFLLWIQTAFAALSSSLPVAVCSLLQTRTEEPLLVTFFIGCRCFFLVLGVFITAMSVCRLWPAVCLLQYAPTAIDAFRLCQHITKGRVQTLLQAGRYIWFPPFYRIQQILTVRQLLKRKWSHTLQDAEKHGIISRI